MCVNFVPASTELLQTPQISGPFMLSELLDAGSQVDFSPTVSTYGPPARGGGGVKVLYAIWSGDECETGLEVWRTSLSPCHRWSVRCRGVRNYRILDTRCRELRLATEHVLLQQYAGPWASLSFRGVPRRVPDALGMIARAHWEYARDWVPLDTYLNTFVNTADLLASGSGVLAEGPPSLLEAYAAALLPCGVACSVIAAERHFRDAERPALKALLLAPSYIVAREFDVTHRGEQLRWQPNEELTARWSNLVEGGGDPLSHGFNQ